MATAAILWFLVVLAGLLMTPFALALPRAEPLARQAYGIAVATELAIAGAGVAVMAVVMERADGALPWLVAAIVIPIGLAALLVLAVRDERRRDALGWVPTAVLAGFPVFLAFAASALLFDAS